MAYDSTASLVAADADQPIALTWLARHTDRTRALQRRHADGHIYELGEERYVRAEELNAQLIAMAWAGRYAAAHLPPPQVSSAYVPLPQ
jgi:hypothetical protein